MKHITEEYRQKTNVLECTGEEYHAIRCMLEQIGVETRVCSVTGGFETRIYRIQVRNTYRDNVIYGHHHTGEYIHAQTEREITDGRWRL